MEMRILPAYRLSAFTQSTNCSTVSAACAIKLRPRFAYKVLRAGPFAAPAADRIEDNLAQQRSTRRNRDNPKLLVFYLEFLYFQLALAHSRMMLRIATPEAALSAEICLAYRRTQRSAAAAILPTANALPSRHYCRTSRVSQ
jgi:hypothetical protein